LLYALQEHVRSGHTIRPGADYRFGESSPGGGGNLPPYKSACIACNVEELELQ